MTGQGFTVASAILHRARRQPDHPAVVCGRSVLTFSQLAHRALALADSWSELGMVAGDRIAILAPNCLEYLELYGGCEVGGFVATPLNYRLARAEWAFIIGHAEPVAVFYDAQYRSSVAMLSKQYPEIRHWIEIGDSAYLELIAQGDAGRCVRFAQSISEGAMVYLIHTSGTTGTPKGAMLSQSAQLKVAASIARGAGLDRSDRGLIVQPLFHVGAKFLQLAHLVAGATVVLHRQFEPRAVWTSLKADHITTMQLAPTMLDMLLSERPEALPELNLKALFYSAAPIREALLREAIGVFGDVFVQHYGSTEGGVVTTLAQAQHRPEGSNKEQSWLRSAGTVAEGTEIKVVGENGSRLCAGQVGEVWARHDALFTGYWHDPDSSAETLDEGWLKMGDMGYVDDDGYLFIVDRKKDMIISGGENIYPREVENALLRHPGIADVAVVGVPDERWGESVLAEVVLKPGHHVSGEELLAHCQDQIASYKKPKRIEFRKQLPRLANGKIDKVTIRNRYQQEAD